MRSIIILFVISVALLLVVQCLRINNIEGRGGKVYQIQVIGYGNNGDYFTDSLNYTNNGNTIEFIDEIGYPRVFPVQRVTVTRFK